MAPKAPSAAPLPKIPAKSSGANPAVVGVIALAVGLAAGYGVGRATLGGSANPLAPSKGSYQDGYDAAHKKLLDSGLVLQVISQTTSLSGTVKSIGTDSFVLASNFRLADPLDETAVPAERTVTVTGDTKITVLAQKDPTEFQKEVLDFQKAAQKDPTATPPQPFTSTVITLADLKEGDQVSVDAASDILKAETFTATAVTKSAPTTAPAGGPPGAILPNQPPSPAPAP